MIIVLEVLSFEKLCIVYYIMEANNKSITDTICREKLRAVHDTLDVLGGKWKIEIIASLSFGKRRFMELQREVEGIGAKMLSKELSELEINGLISRKVCDTRPVTVEYELSNYGTTLQRIIDEMMNWGLKHRERIKEQCHQKQ
ncbi:helix-turn-helix domain-containing protein [Olivibacter ginsenosidimutans]|uniref:winged helix-turn-helix transcriptional regulator n=1 Tax=Olivibacter ginsenosidimutans TaxID=1176537 RepID=UPI0031E78191